MTRPGADEYAPFYQGYVERVPESDVMGVLAAQPAELRSRLAAVSREQETFRYADGKWSIRELVGHLGDAERVFGFRAFAFARGDEGPLPGFDENAYVERSGFDALPLTSLIEEFAALRSANLATLRRVDAAGFSRSGIANGNRVTVRALAYMMAGHVRHHLAILDERYLRRPAEPSS
jgi:hypothetical protein